MVVAAWNPREFQPFCPNSALPQQHHVQLAGGFLDLHREAQGLDAAVVGSGLLEFHRERNLVEEIVLQRCADHAEQGGVQARHLAGEEGIRQDAYNPRPAKIMFSSKPPTRIAATSSVSSAPLLASPSPNHPATPTSKPRPRGGRRPSPDAARPFPAPDRPHR